MKNHIMLDIETLSDEGPYPVILSIGAIEFDIFTGEIGNHFYGKISLQSSLDNEFSISEKTLKWWLDQSSSVFEEQLYVNTKPIKEVLIKFSNFLSKDKDQFIWGNGSTFDCTFVKNAYQKLKIPLPWNTFLERDVRTIVDLDPEIKKTERFTGVKHNCLDDCKHQIKYLSKIYQKLLIKK